MHHRGRTPTRGPALQPLIPRPYDIRTRAASSYRRDGGGADGEWGPLWASVRSHHAPAILVIFTVWPLVGVRPMPTSMSILAI